MDTLATLFPHVSLQAGVFYSGTLCGTHQFPGDESHGHVHLIRRGPVQVLGPAGERQRIEEPSLVFMPRAVVHRLVADRTVGADVVCGAIRIGGSQGNPVTDSLPDVICVPTAAVPATGPLLDVLFEEAFSEQPGRQACLDRLCEVLIIRLLRHCLREGLTRGGTLAGLADERLSKALTAIHDDPAREWDLPEMAHLAGMSRARFAARFRAVTGESPGDYLAGWRVHLSKQLIKRGLPLSQIAFDVGYGSASAFTRAFRRKTGCAPGEWRRQERLS